MSEQAGQGSAATASAGGRFRGGPPPLKGSRAPGGGGFGSWARRVVMLAVAGGIAYGGYVWFVKRAIVPQKHVLVLVKKNGSRSITGDGVIIPARPTDAAAAAEWEEAYHNANGILEQVYQEGTYFDFSPFDYEREVYPIVEVPGNKVGLVVRKFGTPLPDGQVLASAARAERGPLAEVLQPGVYPQYSNPYAYEVILVDPVVIEPGHRGVVTVMAGPAPKAPNEYLVREGEQGTQPVIEPEGRRFVNLFQKRITPVSMQSQRFQMSGGDSIRFPSSDSFEIRMEGFVEWSIIPERLPLTYTEYAEGSGLVEFLEERVILPYSRSFSRLVGSQYLAREFISGDTRLKFQQEFERKLKEACLAQGILVKQALVRDIVPPDAIKDPINEREVARQQILTLDQQIKVAKSQSELTTQVETANQNQAIGDANKRVVTVVKMAEQNRDVAITKAKQELQVAALQLEAAKKQAEAIVSKGQADANVLLLQKQAEAEPLASQVQAFGGGEAFAQYFFYQKVAPAMKNIMTGNDGPFADIFAKFARPASQGGVPSYHSPASRPSVAGAESGVLK